MSEDLMPTGRARGRSRGRGLNTGLGELSLGGRGRGILLKEEKKPKGRGEASGLSGSGGSSQSSLSSPHASELSSASSGGDLISALGRGATRGTTRGYRERPPSQMVLFTRPRELNKKQGTGGSPVDLVTNYFSLVQKPNWSLYQYAVTFKPDLEDSRVNC